MTNDRYRSGRPLRRLIRHLGIRTVPGRHRAGELTRIGTTLIAASICGWLAGGCSPSPVTTSRTVVRQDGDRFRLIRNGRPYFIHGAGGHTHLALLSQAGGNSIRTWGTDNLGEILDRAHRHGLTVSVGLWLGHERHGFDYGDRSAVARQLESCLETVRQFKDHPAVLLWGIGNEMEGDGTNPAIWRAVEEMAEAVNRVDPDHPTMTVIAELGEDKVQRIEDHCPSIDIVGVNSYGGIMTVAERYRSAGGTKPFIITEFGPPGPWEVGTTPWGSPYEMSSTAKEQWFADGYRSAIQGHDDRCLGSYAFYWGHKQETTATWFGLLLPDGSRLGPVDALTEAWTGTPPANRCPHIDSLETEHSSDLKPGQTLRARLDVSDPEDDALAISWALRSDTATIGSGGDPQEREDIFEEAVAGSGTSVSVTMPVEPGGYRLFVTVTDTGGGAAAANIPLYVEANNSATISCDSITPESK